MTNEIDAKILDKEAKKAEKIVKQDIEKVWKLLPFFARKSGESDKREIMAVYVKKSKLFLCYESGSNQFYGLDYLTRRGYEFFFDSTTYGELKIDGLAWEKATIIPNKD